MSFSSDRTVNSGVASNSSTPFTSFSSNTTAKSSATSGSGRRKLLFGEIDPSTMRYVNGRLATTCNLILCKSLKLLDFWLNDACRDRFLSFVDKQTLATMRLVCHAFSARCEPLLFSDLLINFTASTFTRPARAAALHAISLHVKTLKFVLPHSKGTYLPPLMDSETGEVLNFVYTPQLEPSTMKRPKYGDVATTELLTRQWPTLFHAVTNVPAFLRAFSHFTNLEHLIISCPGYDRAQIHRRSIVDYALVSLRLAVELNALNALNTLTLDPVHADGLVHLSPKLGAGASPGAPTRWSRITHLNISLDTLLTPNALERRQCKLLSSYLDAFRASVTDFSFRWNTERGPMPATRARTTLIPTTDYLERECPPAKRARIMYEQGPPPPLFFPRLRRARFAHLRAPAHDIARFAHVHRHTVVELEFEDARLISGTWADAWAPVRARAAARRRPADACRPVAEPVESAAGAATRQSVATTVRSADIPIMLDVAGTARTVAVAAPVTYPRRMTRIESAAHRGMEGRYRDEAVRVSRCYVAEPRIRRAATVVRRLKEGLLGCEEQLRRVLQKRLFERP